MKQIDLLCDLLKGALEEEGYTIKQQLTTAYDGLKVTYKGAEIATILIEDAENDRWRERIKERK